MRTLAAVLSALCLLLPYDASAAVKPKARRCPRTLAGCPDDGCSTGRAFDGGLNELKNIRDGDSRARGNAEVRTLQSMKDLPDPEHFVMGGSRDELQQLGEGTKVRVTAFLLTAKPGSSESCNCQLGQVANTDNHLVLVSRETVRRFPIRGHVNVEQWKANLAKREEESVTAEFTPRVRLSHPNFTRAAVRQLILDAPQMALPVRVTGLLMFDSAHFRQHGLARVNNWEIHPILALEFCSNAATCTANSDDGWVSLDAQ
ncbi:MAG TPA: hypothetical protein VF824_08560 [Thermoanaerobaculia bacterium]|jgi:hypothetical protein